MQAQNKVRSESQPDPVRDAQNTGTSDPDAIPTPDTHTCTEPDSHAAPESDTHFCTAAGPAGRPEEDAGTGESFEQEVLDVAVRAGTLLVESGAEISRVEETIERICGFFGVRSEHAYVLSNGIFLSAGGPREKMYASVNYIPVKGTRFDRLNAVNQFSREVAAGKYTIEEASAELCRIEKLPGKSDLAQIIASAVSSGAFSVLFGGTFRDAVCAFCAGFVLYCFVLKAGTAKKSKMMANIVGGMLVTAVCYLLYYCGPGQNLHQMIIGALMPLIPGVAFVNGIRDIAEGDYLSGAVRMLDAIMVFVSISIGVAVVTDLAYILLGGNSL